MIRPNSITMAAPSVALFVVGIYGWLSGAWR
jgi:hypothetical protein